MCTSLLAHFETKNNLPQLYEPCVRKHPPRPPLPSQRPPQQPQPSQPPLRQRVPAQTASLKKHAISTRNTVKLVIPASHLHQKSSLYQHSETQGASLTQKTLQLSRQ